jgi:hypothetical protein
MSSSTFLRCVIAACCIVVIGAPQASYAFEAPQSVDAETSETAETADSALPDAPAAQIAVTEKGLPLAILKDQIPIWTSPLRIRMHDLIWLLPLGAATGVTLATDTDAMRDISRDRSFNKDSVNASNALLGSEIAVPVGLYGVGFFKGDAHARETGILSGEALADSVVVEEARRSFSGGSAPSTTMQQVISLRRTQVRMARFRRHTACWLGHWQQ